MVQWMTWKTHLYKQFVVGLAYQVVNCNRILSVAKPLKMFEESINSINHLSTQNSSPSRKSKQNTWNNNRLCNNCQWLHFILRGRVDKGTQNSDCIIVVIIWYMLRNCCSLCVDSCSLFVLFVRHPVVCGVTSLGIDHTSVLGNTIENIAWHKAGIFKACNSLFTYLIFNLRVVPYLFIYINVKLIGALWDTLLLGIKIKIYGTFQRKWFHWSIFACFASNFSTNLKF